MFFHFLSFSFIFFHFLAFSFISFHFLSFSFIFFFFFFFFFFLRGSKSDFFGPQFRYDFSWQFLCEKSIFSAVSGGTPLGPLFLFFSLFFPFFSVVHTSAASTRYVMGSRVGGSNSIPETVLAQEGARQNVLNPKFPPRRWRIPTIQMRFERTRITTGLPLWTRTGGTQLWYPPEEGGIMLNWQSNCLNWGSAIEKIEFLQFANSPAWGSLLLFNTLKRGRRRTNRGSVVHFCLEAKSSVIPRVFSTGPQIPYDSYVFAINLGNCSWLFVRSKQ